MVSADRPELLVYIFSAVKALKKVIKPYHSWQDVAKINNFIQISFQVIKNFSCKCIVKSETRLHNGCIVRDYTEIPSESWQ